MAEPALQLPELEPEASLDAAPADPKADALREAMRIAEALIFASPEPVEEKEIAKRLPQGVGGRARCRNRSARGRH